MAANYTNASIGWDTTFELNEFGEPRIRSDMETLKNVLLFILFAKPGQYPSLPQIGMDIETTLFNYYDEIDEVEIGNQLLEQCNMLGAYITNGTITIKKTKYKNHPSLLIGIDAKETYPSTYKRDNSTTASKYLIGVTFDDLNNLIYTSASV